MLAWLRKRFARPDWDLSALTPPWDPSRPAIAAFVEEHLVRHQQGDEPPPGLPELDGALIEEPGLEDSSLPLPDAVQAADDDAPGLRWAAGARDGVALFHMAGVHEPAVAEELTDLVRATLADDGLSALPALYNAMGTHRALTWVDDLGAAMVREPQPDPNRLYALGLLLATQAPDREAVKAGIAMLALLDLSEDDLAILRLLACHDELTLFAAVAIAAQASDPDLELWSIARRATGWGRVHAITRLADPDRGLLRPPIRDWLLRGGFHNDVHDQYLALPVAVGADLTGALSGAVDEELLSEITSLLSTLLDEEGPAGSMSDYDEGAMATGRWLDRLAQAPRLPLDAVPVVAGVRGAAEDPDGPWSPDAAAALARQAGRLLATDGLADRARAALSAPVGDLDIAARAAEALGIDTLPARLGRLDAAKAVTLRDALVAAGTDPARVRQVLDARAALAPIDLSGESSGDVAPASEDGRSLTLLLQALAVVTGTAAPPAGADWLRAALASPLAQHRSLALRALVAWSQVHWPEGVHETVAALATEDPEESVRNNARAAWGDAVEA